MFIKQEISFSSACVQDSPHSEYLIRLLRKKKKKEFKKKQKPPLQT